MKLAVEILPFYFGASDKSLFGCYHEPHSGQTRSCAVVICQPIGHEYINSHRALRQLAVRLADCGFPVLRFDYFGCGDSLGDSAEGRISQWLDDLSQAILEIKRRTKLRGLCLVGLRLGASLSLMAATHRSEVTNLVLWDPVVKGKDYLEGLNSFKEEMLRFRPKPKSKERLEWPKDIIGFPMTRDIYEDIGGIDLLAIPRRPADNVLIIETHVATVVSSLKGALEETGTSVSLERVDAPQIWLPTADGSLLVPGPVLQTVISWISRICP